MNYYAQNSFIYDNTIYGWKTATGLINGCYPPPTTQAPVGIEVEPYSSNNQDSQLFRLIFQLEYANSASINTWWWRPMNDRSTSRSMC